MDPQHVYDEDWATDVRVDSKGSEICSMFRGSSVFLTGATGFLGKALVEKLLRACPDLDTLYIMCRDKKGKDVQGRLDEIYSGVLFKKLEKIYPSFREKIVAIRGDCSQPDLGISETDREILINNVSVIFHVAATVRFDEKIRNAVHLNVRATKVMLQLARSCKRLRSYVHCSTAFSNCPRKQIDEVVYEPCMSTEAIISLVDNTPSAILEKITPDLLGDWPNTYVFTKAIAENTVQDYGKGLPVCIFRPSIVVSTLNEPIRGWIDNMYGPTGIVAGSGLGLIHTLHCDEKVTAEMVPVDLVVNGMIAAAYKNTIENCQEISVYNYVSSNQMRTTWEEFMDTVYKYGSCVPSKRSIWTFNLTLNKYYYVHLIYLIFLHFLPAIIADTACVILGKKAQLVKGYKKINKFSNVISYFSTQQWQFNSNNVQQMWADLGPADRAAFNFDISSVDWDYHAQTHCLGLRIYLIHDDLSSLPKGRRLWRIFGLAENIIKIAFYAACARLSYGVLMTVVGLFT